jgi:hypothetical protein
MASAKARRELRTHFAAKDGIHDIETQLRAIGKLGQQFCLMLPQGEA